MFTVHRLLFFNGKKMKLHTMILAVALVTIIGPAAAKVFKECELVTALPQCGITTSINDCKYTALSQVDFN
jgi:hypothetical protein